jgi:hypothetical protein
MYINTLKAMMKTALRGAAVLLLGAGAAVAQQQINLTAGPSSLTLPDGNSVPMWGYSCGALVQGSMATCASLNPNAAVGTWSPVVITVPTTAGGLRINLTNNLSFTGANIPTSIMIVGQIGGGLGDKSQRTTDASPNHTGQGVTWPTANTGATFTPPTQPDRVRSFGTEATVGSPAAQLTWSSLRPGTYLLESGTHPSIQGPMGLYGILVVTSAPASAGTNGTAYPGVTYSSELPVLFSEIDPVQNNLVSKAVNTSGFTETRVWDGHTGQCGDPNAAVGVVNTCYPPAVNYTPTYFMINGVGFSKANAPASLFAATAGTATTGISASGNVLVRLVNAGLRMHVPSIVGATTTPANNVAGTSPGMSLVAEDGNPLPGAQKVQSEVFMAAGKTYDVMINVPAAGSTALPIYDRELSLSGDKINRDAGMLAYIGVNGSTVPAAPSIGAAKAVNDTYNGIVASQTLTISDPGHGVIANDLNVFGVKAMTSPAHGTVTLNEDGTFTYVADSSWTTSGSTTGTQSDGFTYCGNGTTIGNACATVTFNAATIEAASGITCTAATFTSATATFIKVPNPGILGSCKDALNYPLQIVTSSYVAGSNPASNVVLDPAGGFEAMAAPKTSSINFTVQAKNPQGTMAAPVMVTVNFATGSGLQVSLVDGKTGAAASNNDYRWIIEEDRSFYINPNCTTNWGTGTPPAACQGMTTSSGTVPLLGTNFHTSDMPYVAQGCTGPLSCESGQSMLGNPAVCDVGNGVCRADTTGAGKFAVFPSSVQLDPTKRYYVSVLPGNAANPFISGNSSASCGTFKMGNDPNASTCGYSMGGAPIAPGQTAVTVAVEQDPFPPSKLSVDVFEDDFPLNGEQDAGGGVDTLSPNEPGLGGFNIILWDDMGGSGDPTGQMTYDMFNQPLGNSLDGTIDPATGQNSCPITQQGQGITGMIVTCPKYEADGVTLSPLAGQAVVSNLMPGRFSVQAVPGADRIARGELWLQTNTLDGQKAHDSFLRIGEPAYFQEFGPAGYHVNIGFANPGIINGRLPGVCNGTDPNSPVTNPVTGLPAKDPCTLTIQGKITTERMSRTPDERLYSSGSHDQFAWTQCYISVGDPDGEDFAFAYCSADGTFKITGLPAGNWRVTTFDEWNDILVDGLSTPVGLTVNSGTGNLNCAGPATSKTVCDLGDIASSQWQSNVYTRTFIDDNRDGISQAKEGGIPFVPTTIRYRDGSRANTGVTDESGNLPFNETFPLFNWYVVETDNVRYKTTGIHTVYDAGGPADNTLTSCYSASTARVGATAPAPGAGFPACGTSAIGSNMANTAEANPLPAALSVPGAIYCNDADCSNMSIQNAVATNGTLTYPSGAGVSTGRIDNGWVQAEGWQGYSGQSNFIEFGKIPYAADETGPIQGHVVYASTRPFDDPMMNVQQPWEPLIPHVTINLYQEGVAADGVTKTLTLVDTTQTSSFDDWAQGFRSDGVPNMNCPGQSTSDPFYFSLLNQPNYLDWYNQQHAVPNSLNTSATPTALPNGAQYKCYDGMHNWNQLQPVAYDGMYSFPSVTGRNPQTGNTTGTNCTICSKNNDPADNFRFGKEDMLPPGKYVVEVVPPQGYEIVKEEDKNILIGDNFIAPAVQQFGGLGDIFILPDQASVASSQQYPGPSYNGYNEQNSTQSLGTTPTNQIVPGFPVEPVWPCVGDLRVIPDYISLFPQSQQVSPFAGATRRLCDRKEVTLNVGSGAVTKFYLYTSTHKAAKFTGVITDDFTSEFDPFSPQFGEKFAPPNMPIAVRDWTGAETSRVYSDWWGDYDGMTYSTWEVNPPNPTGYSPTMMVFCMNDKGPITINGVSTTDPLYNPAYSQFCYELPYMPGQTDYLDTPVVPTSAFSAGYNHPDCSYPDATPSISSVTSQDAAGPWVSVAGHSITINSLGDQQVTNYGYVGPQGTAAPYNNKTVNRHFGFGATKGTVTIGGAAATVSSWSDTQITASVPTGVPNCAIQQQAQYGGPNGTTVKTAQCGELVITNANGQQSVDTVTITVGGKAPTVLAASIANQPGTTSDLGGLQKAIDAAQPGDLIIVPAGTYKEMLIMWKPVRLQGVGAASAIIDANAQPAGKLDPWRRQVACLFGIAINGRPITGTNTFDDPNDTSNNGGPYTCATNMNFAVDRLPLEATVGWDATLNGNLAEMLQEPTLMGAYEGAGITVLGKGVRFPKGSDPFGSDTFPTGTKLLDGSSAALTGRGSDPNGCGPNSATAVNPYPSNFNCNPSSIDAIGVTDASQGGGGIFVHGWNHSLQIANNRVFSNIGTLSGGINIGQGEFPPQYVQNSTTNADPGSCVNNLSNNEQQPYCFNLHVNVHHNYITKNTSIGDELFSGTLAGAGGVSFCTGADYYKFNYNWVCGNMSSGDGGGVAHMGFSFNGDIEHNSIIFNQSLNPTIPTNGGGLMIMGTPDTDPVCGAAADADCPPGFSDGVGPNLVINANLIQGNAAEAGSGGGLRFQSVNGTEVTNFPHQPSRWYSPLVTNNIIVNNVAGWDGGGVSFEDALSVRFINNTVASNDSTATAGILFNTLGAPLASSQTPGKPTYNGNTSLPQPAGLVTMQNSVPLTTALAGITLSCPNPLNLHPAPATCNYFSDPLLANNIFWQNRSFYVGVGSYSSAVQQNIVRLYNAFSGTAPANQAATGACDSNAAYWDLGVRGDTGPGSHSHPTGLPMLQLSPVYSLLTNSLTGTTSEVGGGNHDLSDNPNVVTQYCNGSRIPPEYAQGTYNVPPGIADATVPNPLFTLAPTATVDEGNNWVNMTWGPLSLSNPTTNAGTSTNTDGNYGNGAMLGNYGIGVGPAVDYVATSSPTYSIAPATDFYGLERPSVTGGKIDLGAVEFQGTIPAPTYSTISPASGYRGTAVNVSITGNNLQSVLSISAGTGVTVSNVVAVSNINVTATFTIAGNAPTGTHSVVITTAGGSVTGTNVFTVLGPNVTGIVPGSGVRGTTVNVTINGNDLQGATGVTAANITVSNFHAVSSTQVTATFTIPLNAGTFGTHNVVVATPNGNTLAFGFVVTGATVTFSGPTPGLTTTVADRTTKNGTVTVTNSAAATAAFTFNAAPTITKASGPGTFSIQSGGSCTSTTVLNPGAHCTINVQYVPPATGTISTASGHVTVSGVGLGSTTQSSVNFNAN